MDSRKRQLLLITIAVLLVVDLPSGSLGIGQRQKTSSAAAEVAAESLNTIYLPIARKDANLTVFGAGMNHLILYQGFDQMAAAKSSWTRSDGVQWSSVESTPGIYDWSVLADLEIELQNASMNGIEVVLLVNSTPEWARKFPGTGPTCGPIAADKFDAFGRFLQALVARYSVAPYNITYWEIWNEEDAPIISEDRGWGCWGDSTDPYFGGGYYADMLKVVYPLIKGENSKAQVLLGGLLLDCDPNGACDTVGHSNQPNMFFEGILRNNGGAYFDGVSYHSYDYYMGTLGGYYNPNWSSSWNTTGPVLIAKARFIQNVLSRFGVTEKFLMNTESAIICGWTGTEPPCQAEDFSNTKAYYIAQAYVAAIAEDLRANIWYNVLGERGSGLLDSNLNPLPAFTAFQFGRNELDNATFVREITEFIGIKGYELDRGDRRIWVLWSLDGSPHSIALQTTPLAIWDSLGLAILPTSSILVSLDPLYLEWSL